MSQGSTVETSQYNYHIQNKHHHHYHHNYQQQHQGIRHTAAALKITLRYLQPLLRGSSLFHNIYLEEAASDDYQDSPKFTPQKGVY